MRDDFSNRVKELLAKRVGYRCSNPDCRQITSGPHVDPTSSINVGVAAHITAASPGGVRHDASLTSQARKDSSNGIWLCQKCAKLIDSDKNRYTVKKIFSWKKIAELSALDELEGRSELLSESKKTIFLKLEELLPELLTEMRDDLGKFPLKREFVLLQKGWAYWARGTEFVYYYDEHPDLRNKIRILENYGLAEDITYNNVDRFIFTEEFANYLTSQTHT